MNKQTHVNALLGRVLLASLLATALSSCGARPHRPGRPRADVPRAETPSLGRPMIVDHTLVGSDGRRLRGGTFWLYGWIPSKTDWALSDAPWRAMREHHLNVVRVACAYRPERAKTYSLDEYERFLDRIIDRARREGIYVIIDFHPRPGTYDMAVATAFWRRMAGRYKDRPHVMYELINEPVFSQPDDYGDQLLRDVEALWRLTDALAPETPKIVLTFCQVGHTGRSPVQVADALEGIDWSGTAVGFHSYWRGSSERIVELKRHYPCINTEFYTPAPGSRRGEMQVMDGFRHHGTLMERLGISWIHWNLLDTRQHLSRLEPVMADLKAKGYHWGEQQ